MSDKIQKFTLNAEGGTSGVDFIDVPEGVAPAWGAITGTLANQTDLQTALNAKGTSNFSGAYADLSGKPTLGTAAATNATAYATAAQGTKADSALQANPNIGTATGTSLAATGALTSSGTAGVGYASGAGGAVTQATSKSTGVTLNKICGKITTHNAALAAAAEVKFTVTNNTVAATDVPVVAIASGGTSGSYLICVSAVAAGSFDIVLSNASAGSLSQAVVINFAVIKAIAA